jgi:hypothetical protein
MRPNWSRQSLPGEKVSIQTNIFHVYYFNITSTLLQHEEGV